MAICLLIRHGHSTANAAGLLSGRMPGVHLTERGTAEAQRLAAALAPVRLATVVSSPLERCVETASIVAAGQDPQVEVATDDGLIECGYGAWTGQPLRDLAKTDLWKVVQNEPETMVFPDSPEWFAESLADMGTRMVSTLGRLDAAVTEHHGPDAVWAAVSHGDLVKAALCAAAGSPFQQFQRFVVESGSISAVRYTAYRPLVLGINADPERLASLVGSSGHDASGEATPGGSADPGDS